MNPSKKILSIAVCVLLGVIIIGCQKPTIDQSFRAASYCQVWEIDTTQTYLSNQTTLSTTIPPPGILVIKNDVGAVVVRTGEWSNVYIKGDMYASNEERLNQIQITTAIQNDTTYVEVVYPQSDVFFGTTTLDIQVPPELKYLEIYSQSADIQVQELTANININDPCGDIIVRKIEGDIDIWTEYGNTLVESQMGNVNVQSTAGDIIATVNIHSNKMYTFNSSSGSIYFNPQNDIGEIYLRTTTGHIDTGSHVIHDADRSGQLPCTDDRAFESPFNTANTNGLITRGGFGGASETQTVKGRLGVGSAKIDIQTLSGNITIK